MNNIVLTGFMGAGKSSVGRALAEKTGMPMVDTDDEIEKRAGTTISRIFKEYGEPHFRDLEAEVVRDVSKMEGHIIVTGGGVVLRKENMDNLGKNGVVYFLRASPEAIYERIKEETHRPLLQVEDPLAEIRRLLDHREPFYGVNDVVIDTTEMGVEEVAGEILGSYRSQNLE